MRYWKGILTFTHIDMKDILKRQTCNEKSKHHYLLVTISFRSHYVYPRRRSLWTLGCTRPRPAPLGTVFPARLSAHTVQHLACTVRASDTVHTEIYQTRVQGPWVGWRMKTSPNSPRTLSISVLTVCLWLTIMVTFPQWSMNTFLVRWVSRAVTVQMAKPAKVGIFTFSGILKDPVNVLTFLSLLCFIRSFVRSSVRSFVHSFCRFSSFVHSLIFYSLVFSFIHSCIHFPSFLPSFIHKTHACFINVGKNNKFLLLLFLNKIYRNKRKFDYSHHI